MSTINDYDFTLLNGVFFSEEHNNHINWSEYFQNDYPLVVEIGCGKGHFLIKQAHDNKRINYIGIDISKKKILKCHDKQNKRGLDNIAWICSDALVALERLFDNNSINTLFMAFPDPWPKKRHRKKRLYKKEFLNLIYTKLSDEGFFALITDHFEYYEASYKKTSLDNRFEFISADILSELDLTDSLFGNKWKKENRKFYSFSIRKKA